MNRPPLLPAGVGAMVFDRISPRAKSLLIAAGVGAIVAGAASLILKRELEAEFGAGARELEAHLTDRGSALRTQITAEATAAGRQAAMGALNDYGITPALVAQVQELANAGDRLVGLAASTGKTVSGMLAEIELRAQQIRAGIVRSFAS